MIGFCRIIKSQTQVANRKHRLNLFTIHKLDEREHSQVLP